MEAAERIVMETADGSHTVAIPAINVTYHSNRGAIQESEHVFLQTGFDYVATGFPTGEIRILEMGFGTGLNALLTACAAADRCRNVHYTTVELYPLDGATLISLNHAAILDQQSLFETIHNAPWEAEASINEYFTLHKKAGDITQMSLGEGFQLIYYDAFAPEAQPHLWTTAIFEKLYAILVNGGVLVTYCSKGVVRRAMEAAGFTVHKLPGPPGKREIVRAIKK